MTESPTRPGSDEDILGYHEEADRAARERAERRRERRRRRVSRADARLTATPWGRLLTGAVLALAIGTLVGLIALWPSGQPHHESAAMGGATTAATVTAVRDVRCPGPTAQRCRQLVARLDSGPHSGRQATLDLGPSAVVSSYAVGDRVRVQPTGEPAGASGAPSYQLVGLDRRGTLRWLLVVFAALVVLLARWRGALALVGFAISLLLVLKFLVPAMLDGSPPLLVALVGSLAVMFVTVGLTYGISPQSAAAVLGISGSLLIAALAGTLAVHAARLDGRSSDLAVYLQQGDQRLSLQGVVLAGLVLGALGVLADMAVTQASAVLALRRANPALRPRALFTGAFAVGRDHLVATTHTLVLVYVGATLPLLLVMQSTGVNATDALNSQDVAEPVVATLAGAIALLLSVPLTTALAAAFAGRVPAGTLPEAAHSHQH